MESKYKIQKIIPRDGELKNVHARWFGIECEIIELERGHSMKLAKITSESNPAPNTLFTSYVTDVEIAENVDLTVHTRNTTYYLQLLVE